jgi:glycosyltransferase involved in cell wall biosynthesis
MNTSKTPAIIVAVLAHNEERRIGPCLASLPLGRPGIEAHVIVNGSCDRTAAIARSFPATVHDWPEAGKSRSWNRFLLDTPDLAAGVFVFVDGDAEVTVGSVEALAALLAANPAANAVAGLPCNGRRAVAYRAGLIAEHGMFGDLYALSGGFVARFRESGIRLPEDLVGDDSLIGALAKTGLACESDWREDRLLPCLDAGFLCAPTQVLSPASLSAQYRRTVNYSVRHFQNRIISEIMRGPGPAGLPRHIADLYPIWLGRFTPRLHPMWWWFDRLALARMRAACAA